MGRAIPQSFAITTDRLCNGDFDRTLVFEVYDWDKDGSHDLIGSCQVRPPVL